MTLLTVCQNVCAVVGVMRPASIFSGLATSRTQQELLALANEMAHLIAYDNRDWQALRASAIFTGDGITRQFPMPSNYKRMMLTSSVYPGTISGTPPVSRLSRYPLKFIADFNKMFSIVAGQIPPPVPGVWMISENKMWVLPIMGQVPAWVNSTSYTVGTKAFDVDLQNFWQVAVAHTSAPTGTFAADRVARPTLWTSTTPPSAFVQFAYIDNRPINQMNGAVSIGPGTEFVSDNDTFRLSERLLKLGMIWQWKAQKGTPYAEDLGTFQDNLDRDSGSDIPAPIIVGGRPISDAANIAYSWPAEWGSVTR